MLVQALALLILSSLQVAATDFTLVYNHPNNFISNVSSDVAVQLSMGSLGTTVCTGTSITPTASISSNWFSSYYTSKLASNAPGYFFLVLYSQAQNQRPITWVDSSDYTNITNQAYNSQPGFFLNVTAFNSFMSSIGVSPQQSTQRSGYTNSVDGSIFPGSCASAPYCYKADIAFYCKGITNLVSSNSGYNQNISNYLGASSVSFSSITLNTPGIFTFKPTFTLGGCIASGRTYTQMYPPNSAPVENVHLYKNTAFTPVTIDNSSTQTITVKNPFICNLSALSFSPMEMNNSTTYSFNLVIKNNGDSVNITSISLVAGSPFSNFHVTNPPVPPSYTLAAGVQKTFSGVVTAPAAVGLQTLTVQINSVSTALNCSGTTANCNKQASFVINVTAPNVANTIPTNCTLAFDGHSSTFVPVDSAWVNATCRNSANAIVPCRALSWATTAANGTMAPASTTSPPSSSRSELTVNAVSAPQTGATVKAQQGENFSCTLIFNVDGPDYEATILAPGNYAQVQAGTNFTAIVQTKNLGGKANVSTITRFRFNGGIEGFFISPLSQFGIAQNSTNFTCPDTPGLYLLNATADDNYQLNENNEINNYAAIWINCTPSVPVLKPDYISAITAQSTVWVGTSFTVNVTTQNIGQAPATATSTTRLLISGYGGTTSSNFIVPALAVGGSAINITSPSIICPPTPGDIVLNSSADYLGQINESNETNNNDTFTVHCIFEPPTLLPNYVPNITSITSSSMVFVGIPFAASFITKNIGNANATNTSNTRTSFESTIKTFQVAALATNAQQVDSWVFTCLYSGINNLTEHVNYYYNVSESNYTDNEQIQPIACYAAPDSCNLTFVGHNATLFASDSALVQATCFSGSAQTACPSFLWQQTAVGGSMYPTNTNISLLPNSTLSMSSPVTTQLGMKVNVTSTLPGVPLYCELPFNVSNGSAIGPDYIVSAIVPDLPTTGLNQPVHFTVTVTNQGNVNATNVSTSVASYSLGCEPITSSYVLPKIAAQASHVSVNVLACTCRLPGLQSITVTANPTHVQDETNFLNNDLTIQFICQAPPQAIMCSYFI